MRSRRSVGACPTDAHGRYAHETRSLLSPPPRTSPPPRSSIRPKDLALVVEGCLPNSAAAGCGVGVLLRGLITRRRRVARPPRFAAVRELDLRSSSGTQRDVGASGSDPAGRRCRAAGAPLPYRYCPPCREDHSGRRSSAGTPPSSLSDTPPGSPGTYGGGVLMRDVGVVAEAQAVERFKFCRRRLPVKGAMATRRGVGRERRPTVRVAEGGSRGEISDGESDAHARDPRGAIPRALRKGRGRRDTDLSSGPRRGGSRARVGAVGSGIATYLARRPISSAALRRRSSVRIFASTIHRDARPRAPRLARPRGLTQHALLSSAVTPEPA